MKNRIYCFIAILFSCSLALLSSCQWIAHQKQLDMELEDIGVEAAKADIEVSKKLAEKEIGK